MVLGSYNPGVYHFLGPELEQEEPDTSDSFWDWWRRNGGSATDILSNGLCIINPRRAGCPGANQNNPNGVYGRPQDQTLLYVVIGVVVLMLFILILKK